ncbi:MAG: transposase, partial [Deltaproteobacteria bacterium]|nr:transposase [Deltaproteobacteria bacterium]
MNAKLRNSWAHTFLAYVLMVIPVTLLNCLYSRGRGRPSKNLRTLFGLCIIQEMFDMTNEEAVCSLMNRRDIWYALGLIDKAVDEELHVSLKTLYRFKKKMLETNAGVIIFNVLMVHFMRQFKVNAECVRLDSTHVRSNIRNLSRCGLFRRVISNFLLILKSRNPSSYKGLDAGFRDRYSPDRKTGYDFFGPCRPSERGGRLAVMSADLVRLISVYR